VLYRTLHLFNDVSVRSYCTRWNVDDFVVTEFKTLLPEFGNTRENNEGLGDNYFRAAVLRLIHTCHAFPTLRPCRAAGLYKSEALHQDSCKSIPAFFSDISQSNVRPVDL
jgi:hypothetical protein